MKTPKRRMFPIGIVHSSQKWEYVEKAGELRFPCYGEILLLDTGGHLITEIGRVRTEQCRYETIGEAIVRLGNRASLVRFVFVVDFVSSKQNSKPRKWVKKISLYEDTAGLLTSSHGKKSRTRRRTKS